MTNWQAQLGLEITTKSLIGKSVRKSDNYYVYVLWKMYEEIPIPFYVGKGHFERVIKHESDSEKINQHKLNIIKKHKELGIEVGYSVLNFFKAEKDAFKAEEDLIVLIGRKDLKQGPLTNKTDGGDGSRGHLALKGGDSASARPVIANNIRYSCLKEAGQAFSVDPGTIAARIKTGWEGYYYEGEAQRKPSKKITGKYRKPVVVEGKEFISASEASRILEIDVRRISKRIKYGWEGYYYKEKGQLERKTIWGDRQDKAGVIIKGKEYSTTAEASRETGESYSKIRKRCLSSNTPEYKRMDGKVVIKVGDPKYSIPVLIKGKKYESLTQAAMKLNLSRETVNYRCKNIRYPDWIFLDDFKKEKYFTPEFSSHSLKLSIDGIEYESLSSASRKFSVEINTVKARCKSSSFPTWICDKFEKEVPKDEKSGLIQIEIDGKKYRSISEASRELNLARALIRKRLQSADWNNYRILNTNH